MNSAPFQQFVAVAFDWVWRNSLYGSVLIILVLLSQSVFERFLTPRWRYFLGLLVLIRLVLPFSPAASFSLFNLATPAAKTPGPILLPSPLPAADFVSSPLPAASHSEVQLPETTRRTSPLNWMVVARNVWLAGLLAGVSMVWWRHFRFMRRLAGASVLREPHFLLLLKSCQATLGVRRNVRLVIVPQLRIPAVAGLFRPCLLLPEGLIARLDENELRLIFLHELAHLKRGDILLNWIMIGVQSLYWFNPLVWLALRRLRADRELVCDSMVLSHLVSDDRRAYGHTLIKLLADFSKTDGCPGLVPVINHRSEIKRRMIMIANFKSVSRRTMWLSGVLAAVLAAATFTRAAEKPPAPVVAESATTKPGAKASEGGADWVLARRLAYFKKQLAEKNEELVEAQKRVDAYRAKLNLPDFATEGEFHSIWLESMRHLAIERINVEANLRQVTSILEQLKKETPNQLHRVIDGVFPDERLLAMAKAREEADRNLAAATSRFGPEHPEVKTAASAVRKIEEQLFERSMGIIAGLETKAAALKVQRDSVAKAAEEAERESIESSLRSRSYFNAQADLENLRRVRDSIELRLVQEKTDADLSKIGAGEK